MMKNNIRTRTIYKENAGGQFYHIVDENLKRTWIKVYFKQMTAAHDVCLKFGETFDAVPNFLADSKEYYSITSASDITLFEDKTVAGHKCYSGAIELYCYGAGACIISILEDSL